MGILPYAVRHATLAFVYIYLRDEKENCPKFLQLFSPVIFLWIYLVSVPILTDLIFLYINKSK